MKSFLFLLVLTTAFMEKAIANQECGFILAKLQQKDAVEFKVGSSVSIKLPAPKSTEFKALFLGKLIEADGSFKEYVFFDVASNTLLFYKKESLRLVTAGYALVEEQKAEAIVESLHQTDHTCGAFAAFNCLRLFATKNSAHGEMIKKKFVHKETLNYFINAFYKSTVQPEKTFYLTLKEDFSYLGLKVQRINSSLVELFKVDILEAAMQGSPVILSTFLEEAVLPSPHKTLRSDGTAADLEFNLPSRTRIPMQKKHPRHAFLIMGAFKAAEGDFRLIVLDSNFRLPRIWSLNELDFLYEGAMTAYMVEQK